MTILSACQPREDLLKGSFNPEIFTASLSEVLRFYRGEASEMKSVYTDAEMFFSEATYPTHGLKDTLSHVFGRLSGDNSCRAIHRLETAFGGGKTHTLIACTHLAHRGNDLAPLVSALLDPTLLSQPGEVTVVGISGDSLPVQKPHGAHLRPYTLWGEIAYQVGGESLYQQMGAEANSYAAPGEDFFNEVFQGRKVLIMLDELAQYAARLEAAHQGGGDQLAAFQMSLHSYARTHLGIVVILTLASSTDAFTKQTQLLSNLLSEVQGNQISEDKALGIAERAIKGVSSVVARDATSVVPVQAVEISRVLGKRLFSQIDENAAQQTAEEYMGLYRKNSSLLPQQASQSAYKDRMIAHYPFHPTLIDFLNNKLATLENFQGTRGVLRVLALAVRNLWKNQTKIPMIHTCHLDVKDSMIVSEIIGRTGTADLRPILNADIGSVDTESLEGGSSNAELADAKNPHPLGRPIHVYTWKTVFFHSLVGREQGTHSSLFGLTEQEALFQVTFPDLPPSQIGTALKEIETSAYYLRCDNGKYFASLVPTINKVLVSIRRSLNQEEIDRRLESAARNVVKADGQTFIVSHDVTAPENIADNKGKPTLGIVSLFSNTFNVIEFVTKSGPNTPRIEQNLVFLLVPDTVSTKDQLAGQESLFQEETPLPRGSIEDLRELARQAEAIRKLDKDPQNYGILPERLAQDHFKERKAEREKALETAVHSSFKTLWFPSASGQVVGKEIRTAGGEGGASVMAQIRKILIEDGELLTADRTAQSDLQSLSKLFFADSDVIEIQKLRENFCRLRHWPILDYPNVLDSLIRVGVTKGIWCVFRMGDASAKKPAEFYSRETEEIPLSVDLKQNYSIVTPEGANKRGWTPDAPIDWSSVKDWLYQIICHHEVLTIAQLYDEAIETHGDIPEQVREDSLTTLVNQDKVYVYEGTPEQTIKPDVFPKKKLPFALTDVLITPSKASERGWISTPKNTFTLHGRKGIEILFPLIKQFGSLYNRGGKNTIDSIDLIDLTLPKGGRLRLRLDGIPPESMKDLAELFEVLAGRVELGASSEGCLRINNPIEDCPFLQKFKNGE